MFLQEGITAHDENMRYLNLAVGAFQKVQTRSRRDRRPAKRNSSGSFTLPFGPHLSPVLCPGGGVPRERRRPDSGGAATAHQKGRECLSQTGSSDCADGSLEEDQREAGSRTVTTNDLLDCLVHPDVITRVTELLLDRRTHTHTNTHSQFQND